MAAMDEFREEREALKNGPLLDRIKNFWFYYKVHTIVAILSVTMVVGFIYSIVTQKEEVFYAAFLNSFTENDNEAFMNEFSDYIGIDTNKYAAYVDTTMAISTEVETTSYASVQKFMAFNLSDVIDVLMGTEDIIIHYAEDMAFHNLENVLSDEQLEKYAALFYYAEDENGVSIPVGVKIENSEILAKYGYYPTETIYLGVMSTSENYEYSAAFLDFLLQ